MTFNNSLGRAVIESMSLGAKPPYPHLQNGR